MSDNSRKIEFLSKPESVSMGDDWFDSVSKDHFWIQRRFTIFHKICSEYLKGSKRIGEVGCGSGIVQYQVEQKYDRAVDGFDLNEQALRKNLSNKSKVFCYNIFDNNSNLEGAYDMLLLMDVIEHIEDEDLFIEALAKMIPGDGYLAVNVPALQSLYSVYDEQVGHIRRYNYKSLNRAFAKHGFTTVKWSYWGLPLTPLLVIRKFYLKKVKKDDVVKSGMSTSSNFMNTMLRLLSMCEPIPQKLVGSSLFILFQKNR